MTTGHNDFAERDKRETALLQAFPDAQVTFAVGDDALANPSEA